MNKILLSFFTLLLFANISSAQTKLYPTDWWVGMKWNKVQILVYNKDQNIGTRNVSINYPGVELTKINRLENTRYLALDVSIAPSAKPGKVQIFIWGTAGSEIVVWPLAEKRKGNGTSFAQGVNSSDLVYLLMPDRFSNGDESNDRVPGLKDQSLNRDSMYLRHGGDLQGVIDHLDYLKDLGITTVWMTPVLLNDMPHRTEHGYAITDHYTVDPRIGGAAAYEKLSDEIHKRGMKLMQDAVYNHVGLYHFTVQDKPMHDWLHEWPSFTQTSYRDQTIFDPHAAPSQTKIMSDGWFEPMMPDMNQSNPYVANYLIQNAIWSVEKFGVDGWRIDTYIYNDLPFMNRCNKALTDEFPNISMFGETWVHGVANQSYFCQNIMNTSFKSNLQNTTDFQLLFDGIQPALTDTQSWTEGIMKLYNTASQDFLYRDPMGEVIFFDNHDLSRFWSVLGEDMDKYKMALGWLLTYRGVPELYYGDEILMKGMSHPDGLVRADFPGGFKNDPADKFTGAGRTAEENEIFNYIKTLANFRQKSSAIKTGKMMQYVPEKGIYTYFRYDQNQTVICIMNTGDRPREIDIKKNYPDITKDFAGMQDLFTGNSMGMNTVVPPKKMFIGIFTH